MGPNALIYMVNTRPVEKGQMDMRGRFKKSASSFR